MPVVLLDAPLGTYLGWNITAGGDPRPSLEERYADHAGYVAAVRKAAANAVAQGFLLQKDADALIAAADASNVLK